MIDRDKLRKMARLHQLMEHIEAMSDLACSDIKINQDTLTATLYDTSKQAAYGYSEEIGEVTIRLAKELGAE